MALPLTRQLSTETALRRWYESRFANLDAVAADMPPRPRSLVPRSRPDAIPPWLMGMAFDWRIRLGLEVPEHARNTTAFTGWTLAFGGGSVRAGDPRRRSRSDPVTLLLDHSREHGAGVSDSAARDELELAWVSVVLARYESWYRGGVRRGDPLHDLGPRPDVAALESLCPEPAAEELARLVTVARRGLAPLFPADHIETNPMFDAYGIPADGDLLIDGLLLDLKTVTRSKLQIDWLWQVIGYALLDDGRRDIESVGIYLSRHGCLQTWALPDLLTRLAGGPVTVEEARREFLAVC